MRSIQDHLKVKRYESPPEGYIDDFVKEFHQRQRIATRRVQPLEYAGLFKNWFRELKTAKWVYAAGFGYACFMSWLLITPSVEDKQRGALPVRVNYPEPVFMKPAEQIKLDQEKSGKYVEPGKAAASNPF